MNSGRLLRVFVLFIEQMPIRDDQFGWGARCLDRDELDHRVRLVIEECYHLAECCSLARLVSGLDFVSDAQLAHLDSAAVVAQHRSAGRKTVVSTLDVFFVLDYVSEERNIVTSIAVSSDGRTEKKNLRN